MLNLLIAVLIVALSINCLNAQTKLTTKNNKVKASANKKPGLVEGNNINQFIDSGNIFTTGSINRYNNLDRGAKKAKNSDKKASKFKKDFNHLTRDLSKTF